MAEGTETTMKRNGTREAARARRRVGKWGGWVPLALLTLLLGACAQREEAEDVGAEAALAPDRVEPLPGSPLDTIPGTHWTVRDWQILEEKVRWAAAERLDTLPLGEGLGRLGETFVGTTYTPATLEAPGEEHLVINLRELDCVTFIENMLAMTWLLRNDGAEILADRAAAMRRYEAYLTALRYRDGELSGYPSRLHYFSEWLANNEAKGLMALRTEALGGLLDEEPIVFMSEHRDSYRQLADDAFFAAIQEIEGRLAGQPRYYIPENRIREVEQGIQNGDIIAATSTLDGLDVAHTGIAFWHEGRLHLLHAPLVGKTVELSELPLAERIQEISGQDGIMVARPLEWPGERAR